MTEEASPGCDGVRYSYTPDLGIVLRGDERQRRRPRPGEPAARRAHDRRHRHAVLDTELERLLGTAWDNELEPFRRASDGAPVRWLNATG